MTIQQISIPPAELPALRLAMRDVQVSTRTYQQYTNRTSDPDELATQARSCVGFVRILDGLMRDDDKVSSFVKAYSDQFTNATIDPVTGVSSDPQIGLVEGFKYARNVMQHIPFPVTPSVPSMVGNSDIGYRVGTVWQPIPASVDSLLHKGTQKLKPDFDTYLCGRSVTSTLIDVVGILGNTCLDLVNRDADGEWLGFPLDDQPGVNDRLHPEEPIDEAAARAWLDERRPGGDCRVIVGSLVDTSGAPVVFGLTFTGWYSLDPFLETVDQVNRDIAIHAFPYHKCDVESHIAIMGRSYRCLADPKQWVGAQLESIAPQEPFSELGTLAGWGQCWAEDQTYIVRRRRRLNAARHDTCWHYRDLCEAVRNPLP